MSSGETPDELYEVHNSNAIARAFQKLQRQATREGRGEELLQAARQVYERLRREPLGLGEHAIDFRPSGCRFVVSLFDRWWWITASAKIDRWCSSKR